MKCSKWVAAAWIAAVTIPAFAATVFLVGCCMLPFHGLIHRAMPLCEMAAHVMRGEHGDDHHRHSRTVPLPEKQEPVQRVAKFIRPPGFAPSTVTVVAPSPATRPAAYRSFITLGAVRCDDDVGTRLATLDTLRI